MEVTPPRGEDELLIFTSSLLAERRKAPGLKLNHPEVVAMFLRRHGRFQPALCCSLRHRRAPLAGRVSNCAATGPARRWPANACSAIQPARWC
ncbi:MAG: urease subunit gamma [Microbacteriaceae bacterium]|nr:urease subunit gamma [Burkholderiaceae bacterium]